MYSECLNNLIITADDFGADEKNNVLILELAKKKKIDRVAVLIGGIISEKEIQELQESGVKIDVHLHLFEKDYFEKRNGEGDRNFWKRIAMFLLDYIVGRYSTSRVKIIWKKQIEEFHRIFKKFPDGINSHEHLHFFPPFFRVTLALKDKFDIPFIRLAKIGLGGKFGRISVILDRLRRINIRWNRLYFTPPEIAQDFSFVLNTSDYLASFDWLKNKEEFFENIPCPGQTELIFHPEREEEANFLKENFN